MSYHATFEHIRRIARKRELLAAAQLEAEGQFLEAVRRDFNAGKVTVDGLVDLYYEYRDVSGPGYSKRWDAVIPLHAAQLVYQRRRVQPVPEPESGWIGTYPTTECWVPQPGTNVVYVLFDADNVPCYVGSSQNLRARMKAHHRDGKRFATWQARSCGTRDEAYRLERAWLQKYMPYLNKRAC